MADEEETGGQFPGKGLLAELQAGPDKAPELFLILKDRKPVRPATMQEYALFCSDESNRIIKKDFLGRDGQPPEVSTVFLGIDRSTPFNEELRCFETMVFWKGSEYDLQRWNWNTYEQALEGHEAAVRAVKLVLQAITDKGQDDGKE